LHRHSSFIWFKIPAPPDGLKFGNPRHFM